MGAAAESRKPQPALEPGINLLELCRLEGAQPPEKLGGGHGEQARDIECAGLKPPNLEDYVKLQTTRRRNERDNTDKGVVGISLRNADQQNRGILHELCHRAASVGVLGKPR